MPTKLGGPKQNKPDDDLLSFLSGSGSLSHSIGRAIAPNGRLITHDYSIERVNAANEDFRRHGIDSIVESSQRNVLLDGFAPECKEQKVTPFKKRAFQC